MRSAWSIAANARTAALLHSLDGRGDRGGAATGGCCHRISRSLACVRGGWSLARPARRRRVLRGRRAKAGARLRRRAQACPHRRGTLRRGSHARRRRRLACQLCFVDSGRRRQKQVHRIATLWRLQAPLLRPEQMRALSPKCSSALRDWSSRSLRLNCVKLRKHETTYNKRRKTYEWHLPATT